MELSLSLRNFRHGKQKQKWLSIQWHILNKFVLHAYNIINHFVQYTETNLVLIIYKLSL